MRTEMEKAVRVIEAISVAPGPREAFSRLVELRTLLEGAERSAALDLADSGVSWREIADLAGRTHNSARAAYLKEPVEKDEVEGPPYKQAVAAELLGRTPSQISDLMRREGEGVWWSLVAVIKSDGTEGTRRMITDLDALRDRFGKKR